VAAAPAIRRSSIFPETGWLRLQAAYDLAQARQHEDEITVLRIEREPVGIQ
jgi:plasmid maintenance system antidote protein VapI